MKADRNDNILTALGAFPALRGLATDWLGHLHQRYPARSAALKDPADSPGAKPDSRDNTLLQRAQRTLPASSCFRPPAQHPVAYACFHYLAGRCVC
jgi:hypothetical protein